MSNQVLIDQILRDAEEAERELELRRKQFELEVRAKEQEVADLRTAARVLEQRDRAQTPTTPSVRRIVIPRRNPDSDGEPSLTFTATVTEVADAVDASGEEITIGGIHSRLMADGALMPNNARIKIGTILRRLEERGYLRKVADAAGNESAKYTKVKEGEVTA